MRLRRVYTGVALNFGTSIPIVPRLIEVWKRTSVFKARQSTQQVGARGRRIAEKRLPQHRFEAESLKAEYKPWNIIWYNYNSIVQTLEE